MQKQKSAILI